MLKKKWPTFESTEPESVRAALERTARITRFDVSSDEKFLFRASEFRFDEILLGRYFANCRTRSDFAEEDVVKQLICVSGAYRFTLGDKRFTSNQVRWSAFVPQNTKYSLATEPRLEMVTLRIKNCALRRKIEAICGESTTTEVQFENDMNVNSGAMETLRNATLYFVGELSSDHADYLSVAMKELQEMLIVNFLFAHKHNFSSMLSPKRVFAPSNAQLQIVEDYIAANFAKPILVEDLSAASGMSVRSLFRHFKKLRGLTPADFVKQIRLEASRNMLQSSFDETSIMEVAHKCGFHSLGHFAREYKSKYHELPSETLSRYSKKP